MGFAILGGAPNSRGSNLKSHQTKLSNPTNGSNARTVNRDLDNFGMTTFYRVCIAKLKHFDRWDVLVGWVVGIWTAVLSLAIGMLFAFAGIANSAEPPKADGKIVITGGESFSLNPTVDYGNGYLVDFDVPPEACQSKTYEWTDDALKCVGRVIQDSGLPLLEPGLRGAIMESQRDFHLGAQNMYRLQAAAYLTPEFIDFKNAETATKQLSAAMEKLQDTARAICKAGGTEYSAPAVGCIKTQTAMGMVAEALSRNKE